MDLSFLKWPVIILVVGAIAFAFSTPGLNMMYERAVNAPAGEDDAEDRSNEAMISRIAGIYLATFRYKSAAESYKQAVDKYPDGENAWYNYYQLARCHEKMENWEEAVDILVMLRDKDADQYDERVPGVAELNGRIQKLVEVHGLEARPMPPPEDAV